jgi:hypothetical protein
MDTYKHSNTTERFNYMVSFRFFIEMLRRSAERYADLVRSKLSKRHNANLG